MKDNLKFKVSSALKNIIGKDLITDDHVAVFELVKNAYDAYATRVDIIFENIYSENSRIIIKDNGKGMDYNDLLNKWLFVAYSAKKEGTEDESLHDDYRDNINNNKPFAGAKGIGRFSCDRLGSTLYLETTKLAKSSKTETLLTEWDKFEDDLKEEFVDVNVLHDTIPESDFGVEHGTVLVISNLRNEWNRQKLLRLKSSLAKLIKPNIGGNGGHDFAINIQVEEEFENDKGSDKKVNGIVKNQIFETLGFKTTKIIAKVSSDGNYINKTLQDGGTKIYDIKSQNKFSLLKDVEISIFYLNQSAKITFSRRMGVSIKDFGHIFLYKNGFRVYPYGEPGEDPLKIDERKAQGYGRYLGTREIVGQIDVNDPSDSLKETSSRGDGLIKNNNYVQLTDFFWETLRSLERYVVEVQRWGLSIEDLETEGDKDFKNRITDLIAKISGSEDIIEMDYSDEFLSIMKESQSESAEAIVENMGKIAQKSGNKELIDQSKKTAELLKEIQHARKSAEKEAEKVTENLKQKETENMFLRSVKSQDFDEIVSFLHHVGISSGIIDNYLSGIIGKINRGKDISPERFAEIIRLISFENKKIQNIARFATKANFKLYTDAIELDIANYIEEYINNIIEVSTNKTMKVEFRNNGVKKWVGKFRPIELNLMIDNLLSNSKKANATEFITTLNLEGENLLITFADDGKGISPDKINDIFKYGFTTLTEGTGIGLYHVKEIVDRIGGEISVESKINQGTKFTLKLNK